jgi:hypothetical protein
MDCGQSPLFLAWFLVPGSGSVWLRPEAAPGNSWSFSQAMKRIHEKRISGLTRPLGKDLHESN